MANINMFEKLENNDSFIIKNKEIEVIKNP